MDFTKMAEEIINSILLEENENDPYDQILEDNLDGIGAMINLGRDRTAINKSQLAEYNAILDKKTCELCAWLDGSVFEVGSDEYKQYMPRIHNRCRCIYVYIGEDEDSPPELSFKKPPNDLIETHGQLVGKQIPGTSKKTDSASGSMIDLIKKALPEEEKKKTTTTDIDEESEEYKEKKDYEG